MKDLYVKIGEQRIGLREFDGQIQASIKQGMEAGSVVFELNQSAWSGSESNLPQGVQGVYVSGSYPSIPVKAGSPIAVAGEVAFFRTDEGQQKAYRNLLVVSGSSQWFFGSEFKDFPEHYYSGSHPTGSIWQKMHPNWPKT